VRRGDMGAESRVDDGALRRSSTNIVVNNEDVSKRCGDFTWEDACNVNPKGGIGRLWPERLGL
jgi:hypothetical protein